MQKNVSTPFFVCPICSNHITDADPGAQEIGASLVCGSCIADFNLRRASEQKCLSCGGDILALFNGQWFCLENGCSACSPEFDDPRNMEPLVRFFKLIMRKFGPSDPEQFRAWIRGRAVKRRLKGHTEQEILDAIRSVRTLPIVANQTAMQALNISEAELYRRTSDGRLRRARKGFVYSAQVIQTLDRGLAELKK